MQEYITETLDKILPVVDRVHGEHHPELHQVLKLYHQIKEEQKAEYFEELRQVTSNYSVPEDACPTYAKAYTFLDMLDQEFRQ